MRLSICLAAIQASQIKTFHFFALSASRYGLVLVLSKSYEFIEHFEQPYKQH